MTYLFRLFNNTLFGIVYFYFLSCLFSFQSSFAADRTVFAIDLIRHGDRTPVAEIPKLPYRWESLLVSPWMTLELSLPTLPSLPKPPIQKDALGVLTPQGREQEFQLGRSLKQEYIDTHFLPDRFNEGTLYVRSTYTKRTINSARFFLSGLYGADSVNIPIHIEPKESDTLLLTKPDSRVWSQIKLFLKERSEWKEKTYAIEAKLQHWRRSTGFSLKNFDDFILLADNLFIRQIYHLPFPEALSPQDIEEITALAEWYMLNKFKTPEVSYPTGKTFLSEVLRSFEKTQSAESTLRYILYSGHDSSIMSVLSALGGPLNKIPPYASRLNFSLLENDGVLFVRITLNSQPVLVPACRNTHQCTLAELRKRIKDIRI